MLGGANHVIPSGFCLSRIIFYNPAIPSGLKLRNISNLGLSLLRSPNASRPDFGAKSGDFAVQAKVL